MKALVFAMALVFALFGAAAHAGVAPNTGATQSQSGAKIAPSKKAEEQQPETEAERPQDKQH